MTTAEEYMSRVIEAMENPKPAISLRDWFAGQAMAGWLASFGPDDAVKARSCADLAYEIADAMLAAREATDDL